MRFYNLERLASGVAQRPVLIGDAGFVEQRLRVEDSLLGGLEHGVEPAQHGYRGG
jgi:hypothetical protein